jgi:L-aspartate oxidase
MMCGIKTDRNGATNIEGLCAAGEVACTGVHGANRLASNSLLEGLVFGARAGRTALNFSMSNKLLDLSSNKISRCFQEVAYSSIPDYEEIRHSLRKLMWERVGIIRCEESLSEAKAKLEEWSFILDKNFITRRELELKNMLTVAKLVTEAAILRKGSVGAHYRSDFPQRGVRWQEHIALMSGEKGLRYEFIK